MDEIEVTCAKQHCTNTMTVPKEAYDKGYLWAIYCASCVDCDNYLRSIGRL